MEGDFNGAMKILLGYRMVRSAQQLQLIPDECYGSRPGCTALQVSLGRTLTADIARQSRATLAVASVDCRTCYDSVSHPPASIACQRLGVSPTVLETIFSSIQSMNIFLRTAHGDSSASYNGLSSTGLPFQGVCQGNGAGPALWLATSIPLIESVRRNGQLASFISPITRQHASLVGFLYVDDCDLLAFGSAAVPHEQVIEALQRNVNLWQGGLRATGSSLSHKKCSWSLLSFQRRGHRRLLRNEISAPASISIKDHLGTSIPIRRLSPQEGLEVVGVVQALSGDARPSLTALQLKSNSWLEAIKSNFLPRHLLWTALHQVIWPSLRYPLGVTTFDQTQAGSITSRLFQTLLPRLGVNRHFPTALRHASPSYLGLGIPHPFWEQGIAQLRLFLELASAPTTEAKLIRTSLEFLQLELGSSGNLFQLPFDRWSPLATDCWVKSLWRFIDFADLQLVPESPVLPPAPRLGDAAIMDSAMLSALPLPSILAINRCRIAHQAIFWSNIATGCGDSISLQFLQPPKTTASSSWLWPPETPSRSDWSTWASFLRNSPYTSNLRLLVPLGAWTAESHRLDFLPFDPVTATVATPGHDQYWRLFTSDQVRPYRSLRTFRFARLSINYPFFPHLARVEYKSTTEIQLSGSAPRPNTAPSPGVPWPLRFAHLESISPILLQAIAAGTALAICDGSYMPRRYPQLAAAAWILHSGSAPAASCHGVTQVHGHSSSINSYRAELQGLHALLLALVSLCTQHDLVSGHVTIGCDNKGVLSLMHRPRTYISGSSKHQDLLWAIIHTRRLCPLSLSFQYVAGHQDELSRFEDLPLLAQLNVQADSLAKQALHILGSQHASPVLSTLPNVGWMLLIKDVPISADPRPALLDHLSFRAAIPYWIKRGHFSAHSASLVDWSLLNDALSPFPATYRMWASKFASGHSAVGLTLARWKQWDSPLCPLCRLSEESTLHVLQCPHPHQTHCWHQAVDSLHTWLKEADTAPFITSCFVTSLHQRGLNPFSTMPRSPATTAASHQAKIGFFNTLLGCLSPDWESLQAQHWSTSNSSKSSRLWAKRFCAQLLQVSHSMWLSRNQELQSLNLANLTSSTQEQIRHEFNLGVQNLLPQDRFYVLPSTTFDGFSLDRVLNMPLSDQQLWLTSIRSARSRGAQLSQAELSAMQSNLRHWLLPTALSS